jgi:hypothetical protein
MIVAEEAKGIASPHDSVGTMEVMRRESQPRSPCAARAAAVAVDQPVERD